MLSRALPRGIGRTSAPEVAIILLAVWLVHMGHILRVKKSELEVRIKLLEIEFRLATLAERLEDSILGGDEWSNEYA